MVDVDLFLQRLWREFKQEKAQQPDRPMSSRPISESAALTTFTATTQNNRANNGGAVNKDFDFATYFFLSKPIARLFPKYIESQFVLFYHSTTPIISIYPSHSVKSTTNSIRMPSQFITPPFLEYDQLPSVLSPVYFQQWFQQLSSSLFWKGIMKSMLLAIGSWPWIIQYFIMAYLVIAFFFFLWYVLSDEQYTLSVFWWIAVTLLCLIILPALWVYRGFMYRTLSTPISFDLESLLFKSEEGDRFQNTQINEREDSDEQLPPNRRRRRRQTSHTGGETSLEETTGNRDDEDDDGEGRVVIDIKVDDEDDQTKNDFRNAIQVSPIDYRVLTPNKPVAKAEVYHSPASKSRKIIDGLYDQVSSNKEQILKDLKISDPNEVNVLSASEASEDEKENA